MFGLSAVLAVLQLLGMAFMPLSPRWLMSKGRRNEAYAVLVQIRRSQVSGRCTVVRTCSHAMCIMRVIA